MQKTIPQLLAVVRALSEQRFSSYEHFREKVTFQKRKFAFSCFFCAFLWSRILLKLLLGIFVIILIILVKTRALLSWRFPSGEFFCLFLRFEKDEFQDRVGWNCCRRHVKGKEATSNTKIVANMPTAAAAAAAAATSTFTATVITANIIDQTFTIFFGRRELPLLVFIFWFFYGNQTWVLNRAWLIVYWASSTSPGPSWFWQFFVNLRG